MRVLRMLRSKGKGERERRGEARRLDNLESSVRLSCDCRYSLIWLSLIEDIHCCELLVVTNIYRQCDPLGKYSRYTYLLEHTYGCHASPIHLAEELAGQTHQSSSSTAALVLHVHPRVIV
jgi:hypothetical protein